MCALNSLSKFLTLLWSLSLWLSLLLFEDWNQLLPPSVPKRVTSDYTFSERISFKISVGFHVMSLSIKSRCVASLSFMALATHLGTDRSNCYFNSASCRMEIVTLVCTSDTQKCYSSMQHIHPRRRNPDSGFAVHDWLAPYIPAESTIILFLILLNPELT